MSTGIIPPIPQRDPAAPATLKLDLPGNKSGIDSTLAFDVQKLAFETVAPIGKKIAGRIGTHLGSHQGQTVQLIYLDRMLRGGLDLLSATASQLSNLTSSFRNAETIAKQALAAFEKVKPQKTSAAVGEEAIVAQAATDPPKPFIIDGPQSALNILGLLATESHYFGRSVAIEEEPFLLELSSQLRQLPCVKVFHPALFSPWSKHSAFTLPASIQKGFDTIMSARNDALRPVKRLMTEAAALKPGDALYLEMRFASDQARDQYEAADSLLRELNTRLSQKDDAVGATGMQMLVRAAAIVDLFEAQNTVTYLLLARMEISGGAYRIVRSLARTIFGGDGLDYSAGVIASFGLFNLAGQLLESGIVTERATFRAVSKPDLLLDVVAPLLILIVIILILGMMFKTKIIG